jgi:hypothetical protein
MAGPNIARLVARQQNCSGNIEETLGSANGLLLKGEQIVVPVSLQSDVFRQIHAGHIGISKCIERAK